MTEDYKQQIALARYTVIAPCVTGLADNYSSLADFFAKAATKGFKHPDGTIHKVSVPTIERWYYKYQKGGFNALIPLGRDDAGKSRKIDADIQEKVRYLKEQHPRMTAACIFRILSDDGTIPKGKLSESTICRFVKIINAEKRQPNKIDMRRYERPHINEVWCGDSSVGPYLKTDDGKKRKVYVIALIDDASRMIVGIDVFFNDNFINLLSVMKSAVAKYGKPKIFNFDNGGSYRNKQMELLAARIGSAVHYDQPYTPTQKAKIERWFRTMKDQWLAALDMHSFKNIDELRGSLFAYVQQYNQSPHSSLGGKSPQDRFFSESALIQRLSETSLEQSFLLEVERRVSADNVIVIDQVEYEVHYKFSRQKIRVRYSPDMKDIFVVEKDNALTKINVLRKTDNAFTKREKIHLSGGDA